MSDLDELLASRRVALLTAIDDAQTLIDQIGDISDAVDASEAARDQSRRWAESTVSILDRSQLNLGTIPVGTALRSGDRAHAVTVRDGVLVPRLHLDPDGTAVDSRSPRYLDGASVSVVIGGGRRSLAAWSGGALRLGRGITFDGAGTGASAATPLYIGDRRADMAVGNGQRAFAVTLEGGFQRVAGLALDETGMSLRARTPLYIGDRRADTAVGDGRRARSATLEDGSHRVVGVAFDDAGSTVDARTPLYFGDQLVAGGYLDPAKRPWWLALPDGSLYVPKLRVGSIDTGARRAIFAYGHSLVAGQGGVPFTDVLAQRLGVAVINRGVPGQRAPEIAARFGAWPITVPVPDATIPATGSFTFQYPYGYDTASLIGGGNAAATFTGWLGGVLGMLSFDGSAQRFTRAADGVAVKVPSPCDFIERVDDDRFDQPVVLWPLRNSLGLQPAANVDADAQFALAQSICEAMIASVKSRRFILLGEICRSDEYPGSTAVAQGVPLNGDQSYTLIRRITEWQRKRWPRQFIDTQELLHAAYNPDDATDAADYAAKRTPTSLRVDNLHLKTAGYAVVGNAIADRMLALGYY